MYLVTEIHETAGCMAGMYIVNVNFHSFENCKLSFLYLIYFCCRDDSVRFVFLAVSTSLSQLNSSLSLTASSLSSGDPLLYRVLLKFGEGIDVVKVR